MRKVIAYILVLASILVLAGCDNSSNDNHVTNDTTKVVIPDVSGISAASAEQIMINNNLIPTIVEQKDENVEKGVVIKCSPSIGSIVDKNTRVTLFVSSGKAKKTPKSCIDDSTGTGYFNYRMVEMCIENDELKMTIEVELLFDSGSYNYIKFSFLDSGVAKYNRNNKEIPFSYSYDQKNIKYQQKQNIYITIPMSNFSTTDISKLNLSIDFNINQPDFNFKPYDTTKTTTFYFEIEW